MVDVRHAVDLTPWDKSGNSFMGLKRNTAKWIALVIIFFGFSLADPPGGLLPDDFINFWIAKQIYLFFLPSTGWSYLTWVILTYTVIAWSVILLGVWIYPYNTHSLLNGYVNKFQTLIKRILHSPVWLSVTIFMFWFFYQLYVPAVKAVVTGAP